MPTGVIGLFLLALIGLCSGDNQERIRHVNEMIQILGKKGLFRQCTLFDMQA